MGLLPGDVDLIQQTVQRHLKRQENITKPAIKTRDSAPKVTVATKDNSSQKVAAGSQSIALFGEAAKRSSSRPKARPVDQPDPDVDSETKKSNVPGLPRGKLLEEIAAEQMFRPTNAKGSKVIRARELCAQATEACNVGDFEKAVSCYVEAENLYRDVNDTLSLESVLLKRQDAENSLRMINFQKKFEKERGLALLEEGRAKLASGMAVQAQEALNQALITLNKAGESKSAAEAQRLIGQVSILAPQHALPGTGATAEQDAVEQPNSLVRSAEREREAEQREVERLRALKQQEVRARDLGRILMRYNAQCLTNPSFAGDDGGQKARTYRTPSSLSSARAAGSC